MLEVLAQNRDLGSMIQEVYYMLQVQLERLPSYCIGLERGQEEGREEGREETRHAVAKRLLARGMSPHEVADITGLPLAELMRHGPDARES